MRKTLLVNLCFIFGVTAFASCGKFDEGVNAVNLEGTVVVPKAIAGTNIGMIYVGVWAGLDSRLGYPSPEAAPQSSSAGADTFPFGGTSIGNFANRDARFICTRVNDQTVIDAGANWELPFEILQFPYYEGAVVWAFADQNLSSCNDRGGYSDYFQVLVGLEEVEARPNGTDYVITLDQDVSFLKARFPEGFEAYTDVCPVFDPQNPTYCKSTELIDEGGRFWKVIGVNHRMPNHKMPVTELTVTTPVGGGGTPTVDGNEVARLFIRDDDPEGPPLPRYGSQFQDVLNFPSKYIEPGDLVASEAGSIVLTDLSPITVTIDTVVP